LLLVCDITGDSSTVYFLGKFLQSLETSSRNDDLGTRGGRRSGDVPSGAPGC
jgi:hypothetical protein